MRPLADIRAEINAIDDEIIALLGRRFALLPEVVTYKRAHDLPAVIPARVEEVIARNLKTAAAHGLDTHMIETIYRIIIGALCAAEESELQTDAGAPRVS